MRKLATIRKIDEIRPIEGADAIVCAVVGGWNVVIRKDEYAVGDLIVFCEIDSWVPTELAPFLSKGKEPREYNGVKGERLRTIRLRGQLSQGLILPIMYPLTAAIEVGTLVEDSDVTEQYGIQKWEAPINAQLAGVTRGNFPTLVPKTDQERVQNLKREVHTWTEMGLVFEVTEKLDGSSCTMYLDEDQDFHVCSRNLDLKQDDNNSFWKVAIQYNVENSMFKSGMFGYAIQGEVIGEGIQKNPYGIKGQDFYVFDIYETKSGKYLEPLERRVFCAALGLKHVPVIVEDKDLGVGDVQELLLWAEDKSRLNPKTEREGIVFKCNSGGPTFKAISNKFLLKGGD